MDELEVVFKKGVIWRTRINAWRDLRRRRPQDVVVVWEGREQDTEEETCR